MQRSFLLRTPSTLIFLALLAVFLVVGPFVLPLSDWLWRWAHLGVVLVIGILANAVRIVGAGDAKFAAAAAPFVAVGDLLVVLVILSAAAILGYLGHRLAKNTGLRRLVPHWQSWSSGKRFPMGLPLAITLVAYLALAAFPPVV